MVIDENAVDLSDTIQDLHGSAPSRIVRNLPSYKIHTEHERQCAVA